MNSLQRTVRRCAAVLLVPVSLLVYAVLRYLHSPSGASANLDVLVIGQWISGALLVGAAGYLAVSLLATLTGAPEHVPDPEERADA